MRWSSVCPYIVDGGYECPPSVGKDEDSAEGAEDWPYLRFDELAHSAPFEARGVQNVILSRQIGASGKELPGSSISQSVIAEMKSCAHKKGSERRQMVFLSTRQAGQNALK